MGDPHQLNAANLEARIAVSGHVKWVNMLVVSVGRAAGWQGARIGGIRQTGRSSIVIASALLSQRAKVDRVIMVTMSVGSGIGSTDRRRWCAVWR
jgi:hypothetical protein